MRILLPALTALFLIGCGGEASTCDQTEPFQEARQGSPLAVPEDLARPTPSGKFEIPEAGRDKAVRGPCGDVPPLRVAVVEEPAPPPPEAGADLPAPPTNEVPSGDEAAPATVAAAPATPPVGPPRVTGSLEDDVRATLVAWFDAWRTADGKSLVTFYSRDFEPPVAGQTREAWAAKRIARLEEAGPADVRGDRLTIDESFAGASARFIQEFWDNGKIDAYIMRLDFVVEDGRWMIVRERVLEVL